MSPFGTRNVLRIQGQNTTYEYCNSFDARDRCKKLRKQLLKSGTSGTILWDYGDQRTYVPVLIKKPHSSEGYDANAGVLFYHEEASGSGL